MKKADAHRNKRFNQKYFNCLVLMVFMGMCTSLQSTPEPTPVPTAPTPIPTAPTPVPTAPTPVPTAPTAPSQSTQPSQTTIDPAGLDPTVLDIPSTFTFRATCIKKSYKDSAYGALLEPTLVKNLTDGTYTLHTSCLNGIGVPSTDSTVVLTLVVRNLNNSRTISIRSHVDGKLRNCADISNMNGQIVCVPGIKSATK